jgi:hypothetical protein
LAPYIDYLTYWFSPGWNANETPAAVVSALARAGAMVKDAIRPML